MKAAAFLLVLVVVSKAVFYLLLGRVPLPAMFAAGIIDGIIMMTPIPVYFSCVQDVTSPRYRGTATGVFGTLVFFTGGAWGPLMVGLLSDWFGGGAAGLHLAMASLVAFAVMSAANSSPPMRYTLPCSPSVCFMQRLAQEISLSPASWPRVSFASLRPFRSMDT